jgi:hypothetical protein
MSDDFARLVRARERFEQGQRAARADADAARAAFTDASAQAAALWRQQDTHPEPRAEAARLSADALWSACMVHIDQDGEGAQATLRAATLLGAELYEDDSLDDDVRLHGLYRAQCASFELAHLRRARSLEDTVELFRDVAQCAQAAEDMNAAAVDAQKVARVQANASAALLSLAQALRDGGSQKIRDELNRAVAHGRKAVESGELPGGMGVEATLVVAEAHYEIALLVEDPELIGHNLQQALAWTQMAAESPAADGALQAESWHRAANYACVYGLFRRHQDFDEGLESLEGAIALALSAARPAHLPAELRAQAFETATRTCQNIALLHKERGELAQAHAAFARSAALAQEAAAAPALAATFRAGFVYLGANAALERAALTQPSRDPRDPEVSALLAQALDGAREVLAIPGAPAQVVARAALLACGAVGRQMQALAKGDEIGVQRALEAIEALSQRAAEAEGADLETRARGAAFAADAAEKLAERLRDPRAAAEARQRAAWLHDLARRLQMRADR